MQEQTNKKKSVLARVIAALIALIVIGGSIFAFVMPKNGGASGWLPVPRAYADGWQVLKKGSSGAEVRAAQQALKDLGYYDGRVDGNFSKAFEAAVLAFQADMGLSQTGVLDEETYLFITDGEGPLPSASDTEEEPIVVVKGEEYSDKDHVAAYLRQFKELPPNYITKKEALALGWVSSRGNLWDVAPGKSIGGDYFGNYEGQLPTAKGRKYYECDIDFEGRYRNEKRIIFSSDGLIFYTEDHYATFEDITLEVPKK